MCVYIFFHIQHTGVDHQADTIYMLGNSLGLQPKTASSLMQQQMDKWAKKALYGHTIDPYPWLPIEDFVQEESAKIVGAKPIEVVAMNALTVNVHLAMVTFYQPTSNRHKILLENKAFPSDHYAIESQIRWHGYNPQDSMLMVSPREGEYIWRTEDILKVIEEEGDTIALIWLPGVHFATGHVFDMKTITEAGHRKGCYVGFDLAHAAGNIELHLHDWEVDVASWCTYKYLNGGPGCLGGHFVHEKHAYNFDLPRLLGWWSHKRDTRFLMNNVLELQPGAPGFQISNPPAFSLIPLIASLDICKDTSMTELCKKSRLLTGYLELLLEENLSEEEEKIDDSAPSHKKKRKSDFVKIVTSKNPSERGCQLSLIFSKSVTAIEEYISKRGVMVDLREPEIMRVAPVPLYTSFSDILKFFNIISEALEAV